MMIGRYGKIVFVRDHWEVHDASGGCIASGDTRQEAIDAFNEEKYRFDDEEEVADD